MALTGSPSLLFLVLSLIGSVFSGFIDPQIIQLLRAADFSNYYVVSPFHLVPSSFVQYGFVQPAAVAAVPVTNSVDSVTFTDDSVQVDSRVLNPPKSESQAASSGDSSRPVTRVSGTSAAEKEYLPPKNDYLPPKKEEAKSPEYLPPKNDYLPPKKEEAKSPEYLPPKNDYLPPTTATPAVIQTAPFIFKSYVEPGFSFGEYPLNLVPYQEVAVEVAATKVEAKGGYS